MSQFSITIRMVSMRSAWLVLFVCLGASICRAETLPGTGQLDWEGDLAARMVDGVDRFLLDQLAGSTADRATHWQRDFSSIEAYEQSVLPNRQRLAHIIGLRDERLPVHMELVGTTNQPPLIAESDSFRVYAVRWPVLPYIQAEGLLLIPKNREPIADVVVLPDADQTPEQMVGVVEGVEPVDQWARRLAAAGCRVVVPQLISRHMERRAPPGQPGRANLTNREYIYRSAYQLGRHLIGYEVQQVQALVDWFERTAVGEEPVETNGRPIAVLGYGEGGMLALYAGAVDPRIHAVALRGYFGPRESIWEQPISRNVFGLLEQFGDAELASLIVPRPLVIDGSAYPEVELPGEGGAPARLQPYTRAEVEQEFQRLQQLVEELPADHLQLLFDREPEDIVHHLLAALDAQRSQATERGWRELLEKATSQPPPLEVYHQPDIHVRQQRLVRQMDDQNQWLLRESPYERRNFLNIGLPQYDLPDGSNQIDTSSPQAYEQSIERFREHFRHQVVGHFDMELLDPNPRSRKIYDMETWTGYEVVLDVFPDVFAYGILCVPKQLDGERRPVVVCQHGLEGRPHEVITGDHRAYDNLGANLAERGFIVFAPQNLYIGGDRFRTLQRKAYPLNKTFFAVMVPQHQQITRWLKSLPFVDGQRIAFYGLSYGGKSAMRIPPLVPDYSLSICSADFNEWVWKNASTRSRYSYVWTGEYEIFEFDLGSTFNYAEMAALIAPRPFMVERGHFDGVAPDDMVAYEFAKVRHLYQARLDLPDRSEIEWFVGGHEIHGQGTFEFLHHHLEFPGGPAEVSGSLRK